MKNILITFIVGLISLGASAKVIVANPCKVEVYPAHIVNKLDKYIDSPKVFAVVQQKNNNVNVWLKQYTERAMGYFDAQEVSNKRATFMTEKLKVFCTNNRKVFINTDAIGDATISVFEDNSP